MLNWAERDKSVWKMNKEGNLIFHTEADVVEKLNSPLSLFENPLIAYSIIALCAVADCAMVLDLIKKLSYESPFTIAVSIFGVMVGFELAPIYVGISYSMKSQGYRVDKLPIYLLTAAFVFTATINCYMRYTTRDLVLPASPTGGTSIIGNESTQTMVNPYSFAYAIFGMVFPIITSFFSFGASVAVSNPLKKEIKLLETSLLKLGEDRDQTKSILAEYKEDSEMLNSLLKNDGDKYKIAVSGVFDKAFYYADYVREKLKEHLGDASATNELSKEHDAEFVKKMEAIFKDSVMENVVFDETSKRPVFVKGEQE